MQHSIENLKLQAKQLESDVKRLAHHCDNAASGTSALSALNAAKQAHADAKESGVVKAIDAAEERLFAAQQAFDGLCAKRKRVVEELAAVLAEIQRREASANAS